ncbi:Ku protein [Streptomyces sp. NPDC101118]|uniref:non-homologous end joining protein Ku n=1 Tax=Streptomyces sp. NPDC101118 TaxID=3366109 RepID=UPI00381C5943
MARPVWAGALTFGLVSLPVRLMTATEDHTIHFHQLQRGTSDRIRNRRVNERTGEEVGLKDIVKGVVVDDEYVVVEREELDDIAPGRSRSLEITGFVDLAEVDPVHFGKTYYLGPGGKEYTKVYALLVKALEKAGKAGIATFVMRNHEYLVAVKAERGVLTLHTLHWADEIRDPREEIEFLPSSGTRLSGREMRMAEQLVDALSMEWQPEEYQDTYRAEVARLIKAKKEGGETEKAEPAAEATNVVDLMEVLRASVDAAGGSAGRGGRGSGRTGGRTGRSDGPAGKGSGTGRGRRAGTAGAQTATGSGRGKPTRTRTGTGRGNGRASASGPGRGRSRTASGRQAGKGSGGADLKDLTKAELYERAAAAGIPGRSTMTRAELAKALESPRAA